MKTNIFYTLFFLLIFYGCDEIGVPNIEDDTVVLIAPPDGHEAGSQVFTFWWEELEDADSYQLQIVQPNFDTTITLILDTLTGNNQFAITLFEGNYEWRVIGRNAEFESKTATRSLKVTNNDTDNLSNQTILLQMPAMDDCIRQNIGQFTWDAITGADKYVFQLGYDNFNQIVVNKELTDNNYVHNFDLDTLYQWRVRAESSTTLTFTPWAERSFRVDRIDPDSPEPTFPNDGDTIQIANQNLDLTWDFATDAAEDFLVIYADVAKDTILFQMNGEDNFFNLENSTINFSTTAIEDFYWEVFSRDDCSNFSEASALRVFYIQP